MLCRSSDDPFMLYAALDFGQETFIVTKDQFRDHRCLLVPDLDARLKLWQRQRQITFGRNYFTGKLHFHVSYALLKLYLCFYCIFAYFCAVFVYCNMMLK